MVGPGSLGPLTASRCIEGRCQNRRQLRRLAIQSRVLIERLSRNVACLFEVLQPTLALVDFLDGNI